MTRLQSFVARDRAGIIVEIADIDDGKSRRVSPRRLKRILQSLPNVSRVERITTHIERKP